MGIPSNQIPTEMRAKLGLKPTPMKPQKRKSGYQQPTISPKRRKKIQAWIDEQRQTGNGVFMPVRTYSPNSHVHFHTHARRVRTIRSAISFAMVLYPIHPPAIVLITRYSQQLLDKHENLPMSMKPVVDEIAAFAGVDDKDPRWDWRYAQERAIDFGVRIELVEEVA